MAGLTLPQAARVAHVCPRAWSYYEAGQRENWPALRAFVAETGLPWPLPEAEQFTGRRDKYGQN